MDDNRDDGDDESLARSKRLIQCIVELQRTYIGLILGALEEGAGTEVLGSLLKRTTFCFTDGAALFGKEGEMDGRIVAYQVVPAERKTVGEFKGGVREFTVSYEYLCIIVWRKDGAGGWSIEQLQLDMSKVKMSKLTAWAQMVAAAIRTGAKERKLLQEMPC